MQSYKKKIIYVGAHVDLLINFSGFDADYLMLKCHFYPIINFKEYILFYFGQEICGIHCK